MPRPQTKEELIRAATENYKKLMDTIDAMGEKELQTPFDFTGAKGKTQAHWKRDKNLRDVLIHLYEWHQFTLKCIRAHDAGVDREYLPEGYNWRTYGQMNEMFWEKHQTTSLEDAKQLFMESHKEIMEQIERFSNDELFTPGVFSWAKNSPAGAYFVSNTSSHYDWAVKKLKAHKKIVIA